MSIDPPATAARDLRIDSLRGLMLVEIALVHTGSSLGAFSNEMFGRVSSAAGFVFLSGLVAGAVYSRTAERGAAAITRRAARRCLYIYSYHLAAFLTLLAVVLCVPRANHSFHFPLFPASTALHTMGSFALWCYQPQLFDILPMYALFVLCMPAALLALRAERGIWAWLTSLGVWGLAQLGFGSIPNTADGLGFFHGAFNPFAWQFVFFSGLCCGHVYLYRGRRLLEPSTWLLIVCVLICVIGLTMRWQLLAWPSALQRGGWLALKSDYSASYVINFFAFAYLVYRLASRVPGLFVWRPLAFLGRHSIQVFSFHIVAVYLMWPLFWRAAAWGTIPYDLLALALVGSLFVPAWCHARWQALARGVRAPSLPELWQRFSGSAVAAGLALSSRSLAARRGAEGESVN
jgi:hypothetical protein